jgi:bifunctional DNA-binding transcriptional regulator/antitoxin component of YhaV-PrlF toxin-antitoxin module
MVRRFTMRITATITAKGQVTIPLLIRKQFKGRIIEFVMEGDRVEIRPVPSAAGTLSEFVTAYVPIHEAREATWGELGEA